MQEKIGCCLVLCELPRAKTLTGSVYLFALPTLQFVCVTDIQHRFFAVLFLPVKNMTRSLPWGWSTQFFIRQIAGILLHRLL